MDNEMQPRKRRTNINIHHKNMKLISQHMQVWTQDNLGNIGIFDCTYSHCDMLNGTRTPITTSYDWYCIYSEKNMDLLLPQRIKQSGIYWSQHNRLYKEYQKFANDKFYKLDLFNKLDEGYEMLSLGCSRALTQAEYLKLKVLFKVISSEAKKIKQLKPNISIELRTCEQLKELHASDQHFSLAVPHTTLFF